MTLTEFLEARIAEDEAVAHAAVSAGSPRWSNGAAPMDEGRVEVVDPDSCESVFDYVVVFDEGSPSVGQATHIARNDPARVLADIAAKRAIIKAETVHKAAAWHAKSYSTPVLRILAAVYKEHEDYDERWTP